jgi:hypothetical protein
LLVLSLVWGCKPFQEDDVAVKPLTIVPSFSLQFVEGDSNRVVVTDNTVGNFDRLWKFEGGIPAASKKAVDTVYFTKAGNYAITLYASEEGGAGVANSSQQVTILVDAVAACDPFISLLTGECGENGRCWTFTQAAEAIRVGPTPGSSEWFVSTEGGLQDAQYDDRFCFYFEGQKFQYLNNGTTVDPFNGYAIVPYDPPTNLTWFISPGTGDGGKDQIVLPEGAFIGTWDSGPVYDIVSISDTELVLRSQITGGAGWFEFTLIKN